MQNRLDGVALNDQMQNLLNIIDLDYDEVEILLDQHQEMRLDTNNMSYEVNIYIHTHIYTCARTHKYMYIFKLYFFY